MKEFNCKAIISIDVNKTNNINSDNDSDIYSDYCSDYCSNDDSDNESDNSSDVDIDDINLKPKRKKGGGRKKINKLHLTRQIDKYKKEINELQNKKDEAIKKNNFVEEMKKSKKIKKIKDKQSEYTKDLHSTNK